MGEEGQCERWTFDHHYQTKAMEHQEVGWLSTPWGGATLPLPFLNLIEQYCVV
jgi:hypothetical protein